MIAVALIGLLVGFAVGATGLGAGILTVPLLILAGEPAIRSVGTALLFSTAIKIYAALHYYLKGRVNVKVLAHLALAGVPGAIAGALFLNGLTGERQMALALVLVGGIIVVTSVFTLVRPVRRDSSPRPRRLGLYAFLIGTQVGFSSVGAGALGSVALFSGTLLEPASVVGTNLAFGLVLSAAGGLFHTAVAGWETSLLLPLLAGGFAGVFSGAALSGRLPAHRLRQVVLVAAAALGAYLVVRGL